ncbi:hypothetical protein HPB49_010297 [Dermacentor silvarum]|uniref:Uncharacterized protein n=1 Tax=Dermacentor silvarum TaxID=543639 RepID=A0ACB8DNU7_DERSI|nr:hypothetical protein HPB49_010297 [Dermacentor silvarum]
MEPTNASRRAERLSGPDRCRGSRRYIDIKNEKNLAIISSDDPSATEKLQRINETTLNGKTYLVHIYIASPHNSCRGVIHNVELNTSTEELMGRSRSRGHGKFGRPSQSGNYSQSGSRGQSGDRSGPGGRNQSPDHSQTRGQQQEQPTIQQNVTKATIALGSIFEDTCTSNAQREPRGASCSQGRYLFIPSEPASLKSKHLTCRTAAGLG